MTDLIPRGAPQGENDPGMVVLPRVLVLLTGHRRRGDTGSAETSAGRARVPAGPVEAAGIASLIAIILRITIITTRVPPRHDHADGAPRAASRAGRRRQAVATHAPVALFAVLGLAGGRSGRYPVSAALACRCRDSNWASPTWRGCRAARCCCSSCSGGCSGSRSRPRQSQVAALVGNAHLIFLVETLLIGIFGWLDLEGFLPYLPFQALDAVSDGGRRGQSS